MIFKLIMVTKIKYNPKEKGGYCKKIGNIETNRHCFAKPLVKALEKERKIRLGYKGINHKKDFKFIKIDESVQNILFENGSIESETQRTFSNDHYKFILLPEGE